MPPQTNFDIGIKDDRKEYNIKYEGNFKGLYTTFTNEKSRLAHLDDFLEEEKFYTGYFIGHLKGIILLLVIILAQCLLC